MRKVIILCRSPRIIFNGIFRRWFWWCDLSLLLASVAQLCISMWFSVQLSLDAKHYVLCCFWCQNTPSSPQTFKHQPHLTAGLLSACPIFLQQTCTKWSLLLARKSVILSSSWRVETLCSSSQRPHGLWLQYFPSPLSWPTFHTRV